MRKLPTLIVKYRRGGVDARRMESYLDGALQTLKGRVEVRLLPAREDGAMLVFPTEASRNPREEDAILHLAENVLVWARKVCRGAYDA